MNGAEVPANFPVASSSGSSDPTTVREVVTVESPIDRIEPQAEQDAQICTDVNDQQEFAAGGMMRIVPSEVDVSVVQI